MALTPLKREQLKKLEREVRDTYPLRKGKNEYLTFLSRKLSGNKTPITRQEAIEAQCYMCMGGMEGEVRDCQSHVCSLYDYRPYKRKITRVYSEEEKAVFRERLLKANIAKKLKKGE